MLVYKKITVNMFVWDNIECFKKNAGFKSAINLI
jgi:hypothetical protein